MSTPNTSIDDLVVEIPSDLITLGHDADGLPKTELAKELPKKADGTPDIDHKEVVDPKAEALKKAEEEAGKAWREERERLTRERDERAREAQEAKDRAETERKAREAAEGENVKSTDVAMRAHWTTLHTRKEQFETGIISTKKDIESIKADIRRASAEGEHDKIADLQESLAEAVQAKNTYEQASRAIDSEIETVKGAFTSRQEAAKTKEAEPAKKEEAKPKVPTTDEWIAGCPAETQDWLKKNRAHVENENSRNAVNAFAIYYAHKNGGPAALNTKKFVEAMDAEFNGKSEEEAEPVAEEEIEKPVEKTKKTVAAAPVARGGGSYFSSRNPDAKQIKLPADVHAFCKRANLDPTQYALGVVEDIKAGKLPKEWLDPDFDRGIR